MSTELVEFSRRIDGFLKRTGMSPTRLGRLACNDGSFVENFRRGREPRVSTREKVDAFMSTYSKSEGAVEKATA